MAGPLTPGPPLVVEFVGLPGVGKSHATRLVAGRLAAAGVSARSAALRVNHELGPARRVAYKAGLSGAEILRRPDRAVKAWRVLLRSSQQNRFDVVRLSYNWFFLVGLSRRARSRRAVELLDEGIVQQLWSIGLAGGEQVVRDCSSNLLDGPVGASAVPDVVVVVEAPLEVIESRLAARGSRDSRLDRMAAAEQHAALVRGNALLGEILSHDLRLGAEASRPLVRRIRNGEPADLEADVDELVDELTAIAA